MLACLMLVCRRLRAVASSPPQWVSLSLMGRVRWLSGAECCALERRHVKELSCGASASPHACVSALLACRESVSSSTVWLPRSRRWADALPGVFEVLRKRCTALRSLHVRYTPHAPPVDEDSEEEREEAAEEDAPELLYHASDALAALLRQRPLRNLSLIYVAFAPSELGVIGTAAGAALRTLRFVPCSHSQMEPEVLTRLAHSLSALRLLGTSWHFAPRLLPAFLCASSELTRLEVEWLRDWTLPHAHTHGDHAALVADLIALPRARSLMMKSRRRRWSLRRAMWMRASSPSRACSRASRSSTRAAGTARTRTCRPGG
jgi:hypothetical protein